MEESLKKYVFSWLLIAGSFISCAHGNLIKGTLSDSLTGARLIGANVLLHGNEAITSTDALGNFKFDGLKDGTHTLKFTFIGYKTHTTTVSASGNETKMLEIKLPP